MNINAFSYKYYLNINNLERTNIIATIQAENFRQLHLYV